VGTKTGKCEVSFDPFARIDWYLAMSQDVAGAVVKDALVKVSPKTAIKLKCDLGHLSLSWFSGFFTNI